MACTESMMCKPSIVTQMQDFACFHQRSVWNFREASESSGDAMASSVFWSYGQLETWPTEDFTPGHASTVDKDMTHLLPGVHI